MINIFDYISEFIQILTNFYQNILDTISNNFLFGLVGATIGITLILILIRFFLTKGGL